MTERLHLAMIMDGNRRWAKEKDLTPVSGHEAGAKTLERVLQWCKENNAYSLTLYTFSIENFNRSQEELDDLFNLARQYFKKFEKDMGHDSEDVTVRFLGDISKFPKDIQDICTRIEEKTKNNSKYILQFCFGYGGRQEIVRATREIAKKVCSGALSPEDIDESVIAKELFTSIEPDIVIRTGGAQRTSNFLPWQTSYSEFFFLKKLWPDISEADLDSVLKEFEARQRRFGK
jgi:undecaprenyl diphosphate synthase